MAIKRLYAVAIICCGLGIFANQSLADVGMVTGFKTGTYIQFGKDIALVAKRYGLNIDVKESEGSLANIERMNSHENAAFGIVQSDVLGFLSIKQPELAGRLGMIFPFYNEEVHILARKEIADFSDLRGKVIASGTKGSGSWLTLANLLHKLRVKPAREITDLKPLDAVISVLEGKIDAMIYVAGKPVKLFSKLEMLSKNPKYKALIDKVHFLPLAHPRMLEEYYVSSEIGPSDYNWLSQKVPTIAVKALLVCFNFSKSNSSYHDNRCKQMKLLSTVIQENLSYFKENGHEKWNAVDLDAKIGNWRRDPCAHPEMTENRKSELYEVLRNYFEE